MMMRTILILSSDQMFGFSTYYGQEIFIISETLSIDRCWEQLTKKLPRRNISHMNKCGTTLQSVVKQMMEYSKNSKNGTLCGYSTT